MIPRRFGNKHPTKAQHRASLTFALTFRDKALTERDIEGMARSHHMTVAEVEALVAEIAADKAKRSAA